MWHNFEEGWHGSPRIVGTPAYLWRQKNRRKLVASHIASLMRDLYVARITAGRADRLLREMGYGS